MTRSKYIIKLKEYCILEIDNISDFITSILILVTWKCLSCLKMTSRSGSAKPPKPPIYNPPSPNRTVPSGKRVHGPPNPTKSQMKSNLKKYASVTTAHGIPYVAEENRPILDKLFWTAIVSLAIAFGVYQTLMIYTLWQNEPVITTLDTVAYPIDELEFPAVTICPQGSMQRIAENMLFIQLERFIKDRMEGGQSRRKRSPNASSQKEINGPRNESIALTYDEMILHSKEFLKEVYPGATDIPTKMLQLLISEEPSKIVSNDAMLYQTYERECDPSRNEEILKTLNKRLTKDFCPEGFQNLNDTLCVLVSDTEMPFEQAEDYCKQHGSSEVFDFGSSTDVELLIDMKILGKLSNNLNDNSAYLH